MKYYDTDRIRKPGLKIAACQRQAIFQKWQVKKLTIDMHEIN
jgi:hypothetical protein